MFSISRVPTMKVTATIGSMIQNKQCQVSELRMKPETVGPSAGATEITIEMMPITAPRRSVGTTVRVTVISSGMIRAVPIAWMTRAVNRTAKVGASAATKVPTRKNNSAVTKMVLVLKRSSRYPVVGITTAMVSMKPVVNHWAVVSGIRKSSMMEGRATERIVSLRIMIMAETTRIARTTTTSLGSAGELCLVGVSIEGAEDLSRGALHRVGYLME